jgi:hypothetical protein
MFRMPDGKPGGEAFADLSAREQVQVLEYYSHWPQGEEQGISYDQMEHVFANVIAGKPRDRWLEGTGLSFSDALTGDHGCDGADGKPQSPESDPEADERAKDSPLMSRAGSEAAPTAPGKAGGRTTLERMKESMPATERPTEESKQKVRDINRER